MSTRAKTWITVMAGLLLFHMGSFIYGIWRFPTVPANQALQYGFFWAYILSAAAFILTAVIGGLVWLWSDDV